MKINNFIEKGAPEHIVQKRFLDISRAVNGNIEFGNPKDGPVNVNGSWHDIITPGANVEFTLTHNLGRIPVGIHVISLDQAAIIYASRKSQWTATQAFFKCSNATVALTAFVI